MHLFSANYIDIHLGDHRFEEFEIDRVGLLSYKEAFNEALEKAYDNSRANEYLEGIDFICIKEVNR